jgi:hypothetical protein
MDQPTSVEILYQSELLTVYRCGPACVHLRFGTVTLKLSPSEFWELLQGVGEASVRLSVRDVVESYSKAH